MGSPGCWGVGRKWLGAGGLSYQGSRRPLPMVAAEALAFDTRWQHLCLVRALCPLMGAGQGAQEPPANPQGSPLQPAGPGAPVQPLP